MSKDNYDPQTLDNYVPFHSAFTKKDYLTIAGFGAVFAPFGWFIANGKNTKVRVLGMCACACLGMYCGHCVAVTSARERIEKKRWEEHGC